MFRHIHDAVPELLKNELLRLVTISRNWVNIEWEPQSAAGEDGVIAPPRAWERRYGCRSTVDSPLERLWKNGADALALWAQSIWLADGPKVFRPTPEQARAMEQIEIRLNLDEYSQPYQAILIDLPPGYDPFLNVLVCRHPEVLIAVAVTPGNRDDIVTTTAKRGRPVEEAVQHYDDDCEHLGRLCARALRVAFNSCLVLSNYPNTSDWLYPKEVQSDQRLAREDGERGERARGRLRTALTLIRLDHEVVLHRVVTRDAEPGAATGREMPWHWRRGHWRNTPCGVGHQQRRRVLIKPVLVRADLIVDGEAGPPPTTIYRT
jgi:hypothetical protein